MRSEEEIKFIKEFINARPECKVYLGTDSQRQRKNKVKYATVIVVHFMENGQGKGAKIFADITFEETKDHKLSRPFNRMMKEVQLVTELYEQLEDVLIERDFEIHLDVSSDENCGSSIAYHAARGMILGMIGVEPITKPDAWVASTAADRYSK